MCHIKSWKILVKRSYFGKLGFFQPILNKELNFQDNFVFWKWSHRWNLTTFFSMKWAKNYNEKFVFLNSFQNIEKQLWHVLTSMWNKRKIFMKAPVTNFWTNTKNWKIYKVDKKFVKINWKGFLKTCRKTSFCNLEWRNQQQYLLGSLFWKFL